MNDSFVLGFYHDITLIHYVTYFVNVAACSCSFSSVSACCCCYSGPGLVSSKTLLMLALPVSIILCYNHTTTTIMPLSQALPLVSSVVVVFPHYSRCTLV